MIRTIPLDKLVPSPRNVRRGIDEQADCELKADIAARGLLQNLVVTSTRKPRGCFAVEAGERRRSALQSLADDDALAADFEVACLVVDGAESGREASLAENFQRLAMNPADECLAFQALIEQGADVEGVARRFGLTVRFVEGRLRLAGLAPQVFEALGAGTISLDVAKAYAATPDRERQAWVFEQLGVYGGHYPDSVRRMMTQATVSAADRRARFVGEEAYLAAGGRIERDLFADDEAARWLDVALLERLAGERMEQLAETMAAETGLAFVRPTLETWVGYGRLDGLARVPVEAAPLSDDEQAAIDTLQAEIDGLVAMLEDEDSDPAEHDTAEAQVADLAARIDAIADKPPVLDDALKAEVGTFLLLGDDGQPRLDRGYYREIVEDEIGEGADSAGSGARAGTAASAGSADRERKPAVLAQRLVDELAIQRRDILAFHLAVDPAMALDLAVFLMADRETGGYWRDRSGSSLMAISPGDPVFGFRTPGAPATLGREQVSDGLDRSWTDGETRAERFDAFRALPDAARAAWLGHCVAGTLEASLNLPGGRACALHDHLGHVLGIEVARWWRPTGVNYFDRVPRSVCLAALAEVGGPELVARYAKAKKAELAQACERLFAGELVVEAEVRAAALAWVPEAMRFVASPGETGQAEDDEPGDAAGGDQGIGGDEDAGSEDGLEGVGHEVAGDEDAGHEGIEADGAEVAGADAERGVGDARPGCAADPGTEDAEPDGHGAVPEPLEEAA
jgi:ParB family chromosome partitioning protein